MSSNDKTIETVPKDVIAPEKSKKSKTWIWIFLAVVLIFIVIIVVVIIIAALGGFSNSSSNPSPTPPPDQTTTCPSNVTGVPVYNSVTSGGVSPELVSDGPTYLTNSGSQNGSTNNPEIKTENALGWALINNSSDQIQVYFYSIDSNGNHKTTYTNFSAASNSVMTWQATNGDFTNTDKPVFKGMTVQLYVLTDFKGLSSNTYTIPTSGINSATDIVLLTYNTNNTMTGSICKSSS